MTRLGLDENASRHIQQFPPDQALHMLEQVGEGVRNPSAFVTKMCQRALQPLVDQVPSDSERVEAAIREIGLDDSASRVLRELPAEQALNMIEQVDKSVRNPSAFIMSMAHRTGKSKGGGVPRSAAGFSLEDRIQERCKKLGLDPSASRIIQELPPESAWGILEQIGDDVRNPSAFVTAEVRKVVPAGGAAGKARHEGAGGPSRGAAPTRDVAQSIDHLAKQLDLDGSCLEALQNISPQDAVQILDRLAQDISTIRNRSAFVFAEVKKRKPAAAAQAPPRNQGGGGAGRGGEVRAVPCRFFAEGRCKNGPDCRFSHT